PALTPSGCRNDDDCNPGHVCVASICRTPGSGDAPDLRDGPSEPELGADGGGGAGDATDLRDASVDEAGPPPPTDPCDAVVPLAPTPSRTELAASLLGRWRLCSPAGSGDSLAWLAGPTGQVQLTPTSVIPLTETGGGGAMPTPGVAAGVYYFLL